MEKLVTEILDDLCEFVGTGNVDELQKCYEECVQLGVMVESSL